MRRAAAVLRCLLAAGAACILIHPACADVPIEGGHRSSGRWQDASLEDYRRHLAALASLTQACAKARDLKSCDPTLVGPDDRVPVPSVRRGERRIVRYGWLRILLSRAEEPDTAQDAAAGHKPAPATKDEARPAPPTTSRLLEEAVARLQNDMANANVAATGTPPHTQQRETLRQVLTGREFRDLHQVEASDTALEKLGNWLNHLFESANRLRARSAWIGRVLVWGFFVMVAAGLGWALVRLERRRRIRLMREAEPAALEAVSARDWQVWLADAHRAAAAGQWRKGVRFTYWSAIARLESKRLWPADRARTPREYLALVAVEDPRKPGLDSLTRNFERIWYGGRDAQEQDYRRAEELAAELIPGAGLNATDAGRGGRR